MNTLKDFVNWKLTHADKTAEASGYPLVMDNCKANKKMKQLKVYGNSVQDGTPTLETPIEVQSVGEPTVNLFDKDTAIKQLAYINISQSRYYYSADSSSIAIPCKPNTTYTISHSIQTSIFRACYIKSDHLLSANGVVDAYECIQSSGDNALQVTTGEECTFLIVQCASAVYDDFIPTLQIQEGSTATPYEPYGKYKIPIVTKGKNLFKPTSVSAASIRSNNNRVTINDYGTTIDTTDLSDNKVVITQVPNNNYDVAWFQNGYFYIQTSGLIIGKQYKISFDVDIRDNPLGATYISILSPNGSNQRNCSFTSTKQRVSCTFTHTDKKYEYDYPFIEIRCMGMSFTASNFMITEVDFDESFEPYVEPIKTNVFLNEPLKAGECIDYKNKKVIRGLTEEFTECELPKLNAKTTVIEVDTNILPSSMYGKYIKK